MSQDMIVAPQGPATYDELKALRRNYALIILVILVASCCMSGFVQRSWTYGARPREDVTAAGYESIPPAQDVFSPLLLITLVALPGLSYATVTAIYASKVGMPSPMMPALLAPWPLLQWMAFFMAVGYTPDHLKEFEPAEERPHGVFWAIVACSPLILMGFLYAVNPNYMGQLVFGPPVGAYLPGLPIPCGWPILLMVFLGVLLSNMYLWFGYQKGLVRGGWRALLAMLVLFHFILPSLWLVLMGPAAVQVYKQFFGS